VDQPPPFFLAVEDDGAIRRSIAKAADGLLGVRFAATGGEAIAALRGPLPRFVLLDFVLPDMDGLQVLRHLRADPRWAALPVVVFSSMQDARRRAEALAAGASDWVTKPDRPAELRDAVRAQCQRWA
jgi:CheY-like chemotaxis protein